MTCQWCPYLDDEDSLELCPCDRAARARSNYGTLISIKPMFDMGAESKIEQSTIAEFVVGDWVRVANVAGWIGVNSAAYPHMNRVGIVTSRRDRLYHVRFEDGTVAGFYATELYKVSVYVEANPVPMGTSQFGNGHP